MVAHYSFTPAWGLGAKLHYNSGPLEKSLKSAYKDKNGDWHATYSDTYDMRLEDSWRYEGWRLNAYFEILNLLNRANPSGITYSKDYSESHTVNNFPRIPYFGVEAEF